VTTPTTPVGPEPDRARIRIAYCDQCRWLLRAAWLAQELLSTFGADLLEVALAPGRGGVFEVWVEPPAAPKQRVWSRVEDGGFPEAKVLKQRVRDVIAPERDLGHADRLGGIE
jgi:selenoprotein W-related protein